MDNKSGPENEWQPCAGEERYAESSLGVRRHLAALAVAPVPSSLRPAALSSPRQFVKAAAAAAAAASGSEQRGKKKKKIVKKRVP